MISSFSTKPIPISFYEYKKIMEQKLPKTFSDFLDIGYRTGLRSNFLCNLKKENVDLDKKVITGNDPKTSLPIYVVLDDRSFSILERRIKNTESEYIGSIPLPEINFRQNIDLYGSSQFAYVTDQTKSVNAINKFFPIINDMINQRELNGYYD